MSAPASSQSLGAVHATAVAIGEAGILIRGASGRGKSALALCLIDLAGARGSFAGLIGDDRVEICWVGGRVLLRGVPAAAGIIERRGFGLARAQAEPAAVLRLVVDLLDPGEPLARMPEEAAQVAIIGPARAPRLAFGDESRSIERAGAILAVLRSANDRFVTAATHFT